VVERRASARKISRDHDANGSHGSDLQKALREGGLGADDISVS
jgi:hypothetical protein